MPAPPLPYRFLDSVADPVAAFIRWEGPPPTLVQPQLHTPSRAGVRNVGLIDTGPRSEPVQVDLTSWWEDMDAAYAAHAAHKDFVGVLPRYSLIWADIELDDYDQEVVILHVGLKLCQAAIQLYAPKYELLYYPGVRLVETFTLQYFQVG